MKKDPINNPQTSDANASEVQKQIPGNAVAKENISKEESLIPVKGIDVERRKHLSQLGIETASDLLQKGRTVEQRKNIALNLMSMEMR